MAAAAPPRGAGNFASRLDRTFGVDFFGAPGVYFFIQLPDVAAQLSFVASIWNIGRPDLEKIVDACRTA